ncbi:MAG: DUF935 domain-containing protein [Acidobacteriota bacterium]|nr:DUF935 domain-containing protein [Acidobacteriota bacterium]
MPGSALVKNAVASRSNVPSRPRDGRGRFAPKGPVPTSAEVATVEKGEFLGGLLNLEWPNLSQVIKGRAKGKGVALYDQMWYSDPDLPGIVNSLIDAVLALPGYVRRASDSPEHRLHARWVHFALDEIPDVQSALRNVLLGYFFGFSVTEKMYRVVKRGEWAGGVLYDDLLDKPQRWFTFNRDRRLCMKNSRARQPGELLDQGKFTVFSWGSNSDPWGRPMADLVYLPSVLKHHALKNQGLYFEKYASPTPAAKYKWNQGGGTTNDENKKKALEVAMSFQSDQALALPEGIDLTLIESVRAGQISFESYIAQLTAAQSRTLTGQELANFAVQPGSFAQARVHAKQVDNKIEMLAIAAAMVISQDWIVELIDRNFGEQDLYPTYEIPAKSEAERLQAATNDRLLMSNGFRLSRRFGERRYQIVPPEDDDDVLTPNYSVVPLPALPAPTPDAPEPEEAQS